MIEIYRASELDDEKAGRLIEDFFNKRNTPEAKKRREEEMKLADKIIEESGEIKDEVKISCLRTHENLYKDYARAIKEHPEYQKYFQFYKYN